MGYFDTPQYIEYLKRNFEVEGRETSVHDATCTRPELDVIVSYVDRIGVEKNQKLLEVGSGLGRLLLFLKKKYEIQVSGIDISRKAIALAKERLPRDVENIKHGSAENIPFPDQSFDIVLSWAVFDLTDQGRSIAEMMRVLDVGGHLLLTGKNDLFMDDDEDALVAERRSRENGIPNHYTDYDALTRAVERNGGDIKFKHFFLRRGDFMKRNALSERPDKFIEYCLIIRKINHSGPIILDICSEYSRTWKNLHG